MWLKVDDVELVSVAVHLLMAAILPSAVVRLRPREAAVQLVLVVVNTVLAVILPSAVALYEHSQERMPMPLAEGQAETAL